MKEVEQTEDVGSKTNEIDGMVAARLPEQNAAVMSCIPIEGSFAFAPSCFGSILSIKSSSSCFGSSTQTQGHGVRECSNEKMFMIPSHDHKVVA